MTFPARSARRKSNIRSSCTWGTGGRYKDSPLLKQKQKENNKRGKVQQSGEGGVAEPEPFFTP
eukprot:CAMPEP_0172426784 /NCGR_PEP_ID=MMETSP1064-20121228/39155_1 /TAXON_ID=202472 /ORGANISM="Aulacoseira subarctica , Strain CCAP 1002/5" /LENGTH=62 /DNA_ID=CAMNT_0013170589 /DNA_START=103 /DNA_END=287 /DNA_ORIENTATION=-